MDARANEGLADTAVADVEVLRDGCEGSALLIERSSFTDLFVIEWLAAELDALYAEQRQQAAL